MRDVEEYKEEEEEEEREECNLGYAEPNKFCVGEARGRMLNSRGCATDFKTFW